jgi:hypothetical protein
VTAATPTASAPSGALLQLRSHVILAESTRRGQQNVCSVEIVAVLHSGDGTTGRLRNHVRLNLDADAGRYFPACVVYLRASRSRTSRTTLTLTYWTYPLMSRGVMKGRF